jgi:hypothetical protein
MAGLEQFVRVTVNKMFSREYPHLMRPAVMHAQISRVTRQEDYNVYSFKVLNRFGAIDTNFPEIPNIRSRAFFELGTTVLIGFAYGDIPAIIGEVLL